MTKPSTTHSRLLCVLMGVTREEGRAEEQDPESRVCDSAETVETPWTPPTSALAQAHPVGEVTAGISERLLLLCTDHGSARQLEGQLY